MVGLAPQKPPGLIADMLINELYNAEAIGQKTYTFYLDIDTAKNKFWFGDLPRDFVRNEIGRGFTGMNDLQIEREINWLPLKDPSQW